MTNTVAPGVFRHQIGYAPEQNTGMNTHYQCRSVPLRRSISRGIAICFYRRLCLIVEEYKPKKNTSHGNEVLPQDTTHLIQRPCGGGGGGFFLACENFGRMFDNSFPACAFFFFLSVISSRILIPLLCQDQSTVVQRAETTVTEYSRASCV